MGRRPNLVLLQHFERGQKLNDNSNRYKYVCKACGEDFPKGRSETLISHLTKKCPAITEAERVSACLALHGINGASPNRHHKMDPTLLHSGPNTGPHAVAATTATASAPDSAPGGQPAMWTPLETLAEVSRQIEANEKQDDIPPSSQEGHPDSLTAHSAAEPGTTTAISTSTDPAAVSLAAAAAAVSSFGGQDHAAFDNAQLTTEDGTLKYESHEPNGPANEESASIPQHELSAEDRLRNLLQSADSPSQTAVSVAAAATARLNPSLLDPQIITEADVINEPVSTQPSADEAMVELQHDQPSAIPPLVQPQSHPAPNADSSTPRNEIASPWGGITMTPKDIDIRAPRAVNAQSQQMMGNMNKGGFRMDTSIGPNGPRHRHSRARFASDRRKEVQEVRRIGACIRCRILRKTCSKGTPCDTCKKVLSPRVWLTGCVRTKLSEFIDIYTAGVQIVMSQKRVNSFKRSHALSNDGVIVEAAHFPETGHKVNFEVLQGYPTDNRPEDSDATSPVVLLDNDKEDVPQKVENYMRQILPELIKREPSPHIRVTLETANSIAQETNDELIKRSLELWGIVEIMDRERQWTMLAKSPKDGADDFWLKDETGNEPYTNICMQLTAGAERKAAVASKNLLNGIQRNLQDGKTKLGFPMFLTVMLFLNCVEKTTWAFKAWDEENLRPQWPLEKSPSNFTNQGHGLCELLRMLLVIRHILPKTYHVDPESPIRTDEQDPVIRKYFVDLNITPAYLRMRHEQNHFEPTDSRSLEFLFCAPLLLH